MSIDPEILKVEAEASAHEKEKRQKPLKPARSQAELVRTRNSNIMLFFAVTQSTVTILIALKTFGII